MALYPTAFDECLHFDLLFPYYSLIFGYGLKYVVHAEILESGLVFTSRKHWRLVSAG